MTAVAGSREEPPPAGESGETRAFWITESGVESREIYDVPELLETPGGFVWVDIARFDVEARTILDDIFRFHPVAIQQCGMPSNLPKIHAYANHFFVVLQMPEPGKDGRLHLIEFVHFVGRKFLVTIHGRHDHAVDPEASFRETEAALHRIEFGRFRPRLPIDLAQSIVAAMARRIESIVTACAASTAALEQRVLTGLSRDTDNVLDEMFRLRHQLFTVRTVAGQSCEIYGRMLHFSRGLTPEETIAIQDLVDQFEHLRNVCDSEKELLQEVLDLFQTRIANELNAFVRNLTSIGSILVLCTLIAGIYGMNFENMPELGWQYGYPFALGTMVLAAVLGAWFFRRKGWL